MPDNSTLDPGTGGDTYRSKDRTGVKTQIVGLDLNPAGSEVLGTGDATNGLDVDVTRVQGTVAVADGGGSLTVDGPLTDAQLAARLPLSVEQATSVDVTDGGGSLTVDGPLTDTELRATAVPVSGPLTDAQLRATPVSVEQATSVDVADGGGSLTVDNTVLSVVGTGTEAAAQRVTIATDSTGVLSVDDNGGSLTVDGPVTDAQIRATPLPVSGTVTANLAAGTNNIGDVDVLSLPAIPAGTNNIGDVDVLTAPATAADGAGALPSVTQVVAGWDGSNVQAIVTNAAGNLQVGLTSGNSLSVTPQTSGGLSIFRSIDLDETEEDVKTSAGQLYGWFLYNNTAATLYVKLYNATAANVTVGTTTPVMTVPVPAGSAANVEFTNGLAFGTAITAAATTGVADADTGAPAANALVANFFYK